MSFDLELENRRALVTGGTKGIGAAVVTALRDAGARVVATARSVPSDADAHGVSGEPVRRVRQEPCAYAR